MDNPTAAIIIIGNEILSGRTQDTNTHFLCKQLTLLGIVVKEVRVIPDIEETIITTVQTLSRAYDNVFTTGGIGATHDDITAACIAKAFDKELIEHPQALVVLKDFYKDKMNTARQRLARVPMDATLIRNKVSAAPGFQIANVYCFAGIPAVMAAMFAEIAPTLKKGACIFQKTITGPITENTIADELAIVQENNPDIEIGSYPFYHENGDFGLNLVVRGLNKEHLDSVVEQIGQMMRHHGVTPYIE